MCSKHEDGDQVKRTSIFVYPVIVFLPVSGKVVLQERASFSCRGWDSNEEVLATRLEGIWWRSQDFGADRKRPLCKSGAKLMQRWSVMQSEGDARSLSYQIAQSREHSLCCHRQGIQLTMHWPFVSAVWSHVSRCFQNRLSTLFCCSVVRAKRREGFLYVNKRKAPWARLRN